MKAVSFLQGAALSSEREESDSNIEALPNWMTPEKPALIKMMKTPGIAIPTPMAQKEQRCKDNCDDIDDTAFLPDEFKTIMSIHSKENLQFNNCQVQAIVDAALEQARREWSATTRNELERENVLIIQQIRKECDEQLQEHGRLWQEEHLQEQEQLKAEMEKQELLRLHQVHIQHNQALEKLREELELTRANAENTCTQLQAKVIELEKSLKDKNLAHVKALAETKLSQSRDLEEIKKTCTSIVDKEVEKRESLVSEHIAALEALKTQSVVENHQADAECSFLKTKVIELERRLEEMKLAHVKDIEETKVYYRELEEMKHHEEMEEIIVSHNLALEEMKLAYSEVMESENERKQALIVEQCASLERLNEEFCQQREVHDTVSARFVDQIDQVTQRLNQQLEIHEQSKCESSKVVHTYESKIGSMVKDQERALQSLKEDIAAQHEDQIIQVEIRHDESSKHAQKELVEMQMELSKLRDELVFVRNTALEEKISFMKQMETKDEESIAHIEQLRSQFEVENRDLVSREMEARSRADAMAKGIVELGCKLRNLEIELGRAEEVNIELQGNVEVAREALAKAKDEAAMHQRQQMDRLRSELLLEFNAERKSIEAKLAEAISKQTEQSAREKELLDQISQLEGSVKDEIENFDLRVRKVRDEHTAQIDEMLSQLDLVEAEHNEHKAAMERALVEKDAIISALGSQLAEAQHQRELLESEIEKATGSLASTEEMLRQSQQVITELEGLLTELRAEHNRAIEEQCRKGQKHSEQVRNETIAAAEVQFQKANEHYMALRQEYDAASRKAGKLEMEVRMLRREAENAKSEAVSKEVALASELAQSKAAIAASEARIARIVKDYQAKIENLQVEQRDAQAKADDALIARNAANASIAALVLEKEKLVKENLDLNAVCEELMAIVEGAQEVGKPL